MHMTRSWTMIATLAVATAVLGAMPDRAHADAKNEIRAVTVEDDAGTTRIRVRGADTPTFTVYKLERPARVVLDVPRAWLAEALRGHEGGVTYTPTTWAVSTVAAQQIDDGGDIVRVMVTMARPGRYDVKTEGKEVLLMVTARDPVPKYVSPEDLARVQAISMRAAAEAERLRKDAEHAKAETQVAKSDAASAKAIAAKAVSDADAARAEAARARDEATAARKEAETAKTTAAADKRRAQADVQKAEAARADAMKQLSELDRKARDTQLLEDKARAQLAAAQAREEAAREAVAKLARERDEAAAAAKTAQQARDRSTNAEREKLAADASTAEARLAKANAQAKDAEARRLAEETRAQAARKELETTQLRLAGVEQQRTAAERAASDASRRRGEAEAAASDASRRRSEAESAATLAARQRKEAEEAAQAASRQKTDADALRIAAELARKEAQAQARDAEAARAAAEKQRAVAESAAVSAVDAKHRAEAALDQLLTRRKAAEAAAVALETRSKAEARAQAELAASEARKASDAELTAARAETRRLADERKRAEGELATQRKAVADAQRQSDRLKAAAAEARDAAEREEKRRAQLAAQRTAEEDDLARLKTNKAKLEAVAKLKPATRAAFIKDIAFHGADSAGRVDIAMAGDGKVTLGEVSATHAELIIDDAELAAKLERKLDVRKFGSPIRAVSSFRDRTTPNRVRLVAELERQVTPSIERGSSGVVWSFASAQVAAKPRTHSVPSPVVGGFAATSTPVTQQSVTQLSPQGARNRKVYRGTPIDFDFKDAPIHDLLRTLADVGKVNIVVPEGVQARVTVRLKRVPWDQALEVILASHGLWYRRDGNLFRIAPRKELDAEDEEEAARREAMVKSETPRPEIVPLNYSSASEMQAKLQPMVSPRGRIEVDERTNALIVVDVAANREQIRNLAKSLDLQTPQISIEARIVEARSTFLRQFGIQWGGRASASAAGGNATGLVFPSSINLQGGNEDNNTPRGGVATPSDFAINLPAATGTGEGGAIGLALGSVGGNFNLNLRLSALEDTGTIRIISAPKITVLNNREAKISQGVSIPISVVSAAGAQTQFVQADLALTVRPNVSQSDCAIAMDLTVTKNEPDFVNVGARGDPSILRKEAKTSLLVQDGETSVLGGIYTRNTGLSYKKFPFLGDLPVIGWLFKNRRENDDRTEILVFITPKITNKAMLRCQ